ncbi:hypothetical protein Kpho01_45040 [Kitasatospora phosalacinea]|uniref:Uncharacterized protein n=1 Tax=Kitasatospora phosalacinea TaxID=2065 RepID=A0A9W6PKG0_9ACTN|nr:hypothetical protein Kpho01_45040 [Kitasatospora phosalacinea]
MQHRAQPLPPVAVRRLRGSGSPAGAAGRPRTRASTGGLFETGPGLDALAERMRFRKTFVPPDLAVPSAYVPALRLTAQTLPGRSTELVMRGRDGPEPSEPIPDPVPRRHGTSRGRQKRRARPPDCRARPAGRPDARPREWQRR